MDDSPKFDRPATQRKALSRVVVGVTGGIAAYKAAELVRLLVKDGVTVDVILTDAGSRFVEGRGEADCESRVSATAEVGV